MSFRSTIWYIFVSFVNFVPYNKFINIINMMIVRWEEITLSSQRIKEVALQLFCDRGYEGASLADIAELVGIKKSSIYNHYKNKDDLFLHIFEKSCHEELVHVRKTLSSDNLKSKEDFLNQFLHFSKNRITNNISAKFVFRFTMFPPYHFEDVLGEKITTFITQLHETIYIAVVESKLFHELSEEEQFALASHYTIFLQGTYVEQLTHAFAGDSKKIIPAWTSFSKMFTENVSV